MDHLPHEELTRVIVSFWALWHARRKAIHENIFQSPLSTHCFVDGYVAGLEMTEPKPVTKQSGSTIMWLPPLMGVSKINVDAALSKNSNTAAVAAVARDASGLFMGASVVVLEGITNAETAEALACREGQALASDLLIQNLRLASDCTVVIKNLKGGAAMGVYGPVIREIRTGREAFESVEFVHENRRFNGEAHNLARSSLYKSFGRHIWLLSPPDSFCKLPLSS